jgi:hypothetical protein
MQTESFGSVTRIRPEQLLSHEALDSLAAQSAGPCVSLFIPKRQDGGDPRQDPIKLKNLLHEAEAHLTEAGLVAADAHHLLAPAWAVLDDQLFWQQRREGLVMFLGAKVARCYALPYPFVGTVIVANRFHIKPLLPLLSGNGRFYILALSQNEVRLLRGTRESLHEMKLPPDVPRNLATALHYDDAERQLQFYSGQPAGSGRRGAVFYGTAAPSDVIKDQIGRFFHQVDQGIHPLLHENAPLVLAGVAYLLPIYRQASAYPYLLPEGIPGNPEDTPPEALHAAAWAVVREYFQQTEQAAAREYRNRMGTGRTANRIEVIVPAAAVGRVRTLFVLPDYAQWGRYETDTGRVVLGTQATPLGEDLVDRVALETLRHRGTVYAVQPEQMPEVTPLAAILRY